MRKGIVSVIIPTYKRPYNMIERAIKSVLNQTYKDLELIIVDDSPNSFEERKVIESSIKLIGDERIRYIKHNKNLGGCAARNTGIKASRGEFIAFLDDDDEWLPKKLEYQLKELHEENLDMVYCYWIMCTLKKNKIVERVRQLKEIPNKTVYESLLYRNYIGSTSFVLIKKSCIDNVGIFNEKLKSCQDWDMWIRISKKFRVGYVKEPLVKYYIHELERITTNNKNQIDGHLSILSIYKKDLNFYPMALKQQLYKLCMIYFDDKKYDLGICTLKESLKTKPHDIKGTSNLILKLMKRRLKNAILGEF